ncbi:MAG: hypothetical protein C4581_01000 [Nitrospiraceae bacterium]|nr:MAG: hypothetical protein C4581_01000 [Nitrospiraceae bacterium]
MKYIRLIVVTTIIVSAAGFVVWHLMWMTEVQKKVRTGEPSISSAISEVKEKKNKTRNVINDNTTPVAVDEAMSEKKSPSQSIQAGPGLQQREKPADSKPDPGTGLSADGSTPKPEKDPGKWFEKDTGLGRKVKPVAPETAKTVNSPSNGKTSSVTIRNKANPGTQKIIPQPAPRPDVIIPAVTTYPTSTAP